MEDQHVIVHLRIEVNGKDQISARQRQEELCLWCRTDSLWQVVSERLSAIVPGYMVIRIPKIEINLEVADETGFQRGFIEMLCRQVGEALVGLQPANKITRTNHLHQLALYFLTFGYLPPATAKADAYQMEAFLNDQLTNPDTVFWNAFRTQLRIEPQMFSRLVQHYGRAWIREIMMRHIINPAQILVQAAWLKILRTKYSFLFQKLALNITDVEIMLWKHILLNPESCRFQSQADFENFTAGILNGNREVQFREKLTPEVKSTQDQSVFFIKNAGLILLAPFLIQLFKKINYIENNNKWINPAAQHKAVRLLSYVCYGKSNEGGWEHNWILDKILCGMPPDTVVIRQELLESEVLEMAVEMIKAAIEQWKVLKSTTPGGFRELFLIRDGKLNFDQEGGGWRLRVERKGQDALLERIPWGFSVVKLPWMADMILVEW